MTRILIKVGDVYEDCAHHPVYCTESDSSDVAGVSLFDGSSPRSCSIKHCGVVKLSPQQVVRRIARRDEWLEFERLWQEAYSSATTDEEREQAGHTYRRNISSLR